MTKGERVTDRAGEKKRTRGKEREGGRRRKGRTMEGFGWTG